MRYPVTYSRLLARELRLDRAGQAALLAGTRLGPDDLVSLDQFISRGDQVTILRNALRLAARPGLGLEIGGRLPVAAHGPLGQLLAASPNLGEAWVAMERFHALRVPLVTLAREFDGDELRIRVELQCPLDEVGLFLVEAMVVTIQRGIELILGRRLVEARLDLGYPEPDHAARYARSVHGPVAFAAPCTAWHLPRALLEQANPFRDDAAFRQAWRHCEQLEAAQAESGAPDWRGRLTQLLQRHPGQRWTLEQVAAHLHLSPRTLMRHLSAEGTRYQALLDEELGRQALELFASSRHTVESVALALGYQDATAFRRAFKRWFGMSPTAYLAAQAAPVAREHDPRP